MSSSRQPWTSLIANVGTGVCGHLCSVQEAGHREAEGLDGCVELLAVIAHHLVRALHGADRRLEHGAARIAKALARFEVRLFADHTVAAHFLNLAVRVRDDPVARHEARRNAAFIANGDGVGEDVTPLARIGLILDIIGLDVHLDLVAIRFAHDGRGFHGGHSSGSPRRYTFHSRTRTASTSQGAACSTVSAVKLTRMARPWRSRAPRTMRSTSCSVAVRRISDLMLPAAT